MDIVHYLATAYAERFSTPETELQKMVNEKTVSHPQAKMISGHIQGKLLEVLSCLLKPKRILEIGTFTGYSALCLAKGLAPGGILHTIELRDEDANTALINFNSSEYREAIILHQGNALDIIPTLDEDWDIVFLDADKVGYIEYYELTLPRLKKNGLMIADNVLFHGEVLEGNIPGKNAKAIHQFNQHVAFDQRVEQVVLTVRDGISLIRKNC